MVPMVPPALFLCVGVRIIVAIRNSTQKKENIENSESGNNASKCRNHKVLVHFLHMYWDQISNKDLQF